MAQNENDGELNAECAFSPLNESLVFFFILTVRRCDSSCACRLITLLAHNYITLSMRFHQNHVLLCILLGYSSLVDERTIFGDQSAQLGFVKVINPIAKRKQMKIKDNKSQDKEKR